MICLLMRSILQMVVVHFSEEWAAFNVGMLVQSKVIAQRLAFVSPDSRVYSLQIDMSIKREPQSIRNLEQANASHNYRHICFAYRGS